MRGWEGLSGVSTLATFQREFSWTLELESTQNYLATVLKIIYQGLTQVHALVKSTGLAAGYRLMVLKSPFAYTVPNIFPESSVPKHKPSYFPGMLSGQEKEKLNFPPPPKIAKSTRKNYIFQRMKIQ